MTALAAGGAGAAVALGHGDIKNRRPKPGSILTSPPSTIRISFEEELVTGKFVSIRRNANAVAFTSKLSTHKGAIIATPKSTLAAGAYRVSWRALSDDGHHQKGQWTFRVR